jgi:uncharacterized membrane protein YebE (DUF533 family)
MTDCQTNHQSERAVEQPLEQPVQAVVSSIVAAERAEKALKDIYFVSGLGADERVSFACSSLKAISQCIFTG